MKNNEQFRETMQIVLKEVLSTIGPEYTFHNTDGKINMFEDLDCDIWEYIKSRKHFYESVINKIIKNETNEAFVYSLLGSLIDALCHRIVGRENDITRRIDYYLNDEDIKFSCKYVNDKIKESKKKHKIILFTNLIELRDIQEINIGNVKIVDVTNDYLKKYPPKFWITSLIEQLNLPEQPKSVLNLERYTALETEVDGYHFDIEKSVTFEDALNAFRITFSYIHLCDFFLKNDKIESYEIQKEFIPPKTIFDSGYDKQRYFIYPKKDITSIKEISTHSDEYEYTNKRIIISKETFDIINKRCFLSSFNKICNMDKTNKLRNKIIRSFDWFLKAILEKDNTDSVIDYFISIETLFSSGQYGANNHIMAENIALAISLNLEERIEKYERLSKILKWRNRIIHKGGYFEEEPECWEYLYSLRVSIVWSLIDILKNYEKICDLREKMDNLKADAIIDKYYQIQKFALYTF